MIVFKNKKTGSCTIFVKSHNIRITREEKKYIEKVKWVENVNFYKYSTLFIRNNKSRDKNWEYQKKIYRQIFCCQYNLYGKTKPIATKCDHFLLTPPKMSNKKSETQTILWNSIYYRHVNDKMNKKKMDYIQIIHISNRTMPTQTTKSDLSSKAIKKIGERELRKKRNNKRSKKIDHNFIQYDGIASNSGLKRINRHC